MKIIVTCNGGFTGSLNLQNGYFRWNKPVPKSKESIGYLQLVDRSYTRKEVRAIKDATIRYYAGTFFPTSSIPIKTMGPFRRPWRPGEKEKLLKELEDAPVVEDLVDDDDLISKLFSLTPERRKKDIQELKAQKDVSDYGELETVQLSLGGTFQKFFKGREWLKEAAKIKGGQIYIC